MDVAQSGVQHRRAATDTDKGGGGPLNQQSAFSQSESNQYDSDNDSDNDFYTDQGDDDSSVDFDYNDSRCPSQIECLSFRSDDDVNMEQSLLLHLKRTFCRLWCVRVCIPHCYEISNKPKSVKIILALFLLLLFVVVGIPIRNSITQQMRWSRSTFERDYWTGVNINHLKHDKPAWYRHDHDGLVLHELRSSGLDDKFAAPILLQIEPPTSHRFTDGCPPGFEQHTIGTYLISWFGPITRADIADEHTGAHYTHCARMDYAAAKDSLRDAAYDLCRDPYMSACGNWVDHYGRTNGMRTHSLDPDQYNAYIHETLQREFSNTHGVIFRVMSAHGRRLITRSMDDDANSWLLSLLFGSAELRNRAVSESLDALANSQFFNHITRSKAMMCAVYAALTHMGERQATVALHDVCISLSKARVDEAVADSVCGFVKSAISQTIRYIERELRKGDGSYRMCLGTLVTHGTMGDGAALQIDVPCTDHSLLEPVPYSTADQGATLPDIARIYALILTLSSYYVGTEPFTLDQFLRVRVAFPLAGELAFTTRHLERLLCIIFAEELQDKYTESTMQTQQIGTVKAALNTLSDCTGVKIEMMPRRELNHECIEQLLSKNVALLAIGVQECLRSVRVPTNIDAVQMDAHVPQSYYDVSTKTLYFTPAYLAQPWASASARSSDQYLAPLYYPILQQVYYTGNVYKASVDALTAMHRCVSTKLLPSFWLEFLQMHCESNSAGRFNRRFVVSPFNRLTFEYNDNQLQDEFSIDNFVTNMEEYTKAFKCETA